MVANNIIVSMMIKGDDREAGKKRSARIGKQEHT